MEFSDWTINKNKVVALELPLSETTDRFLTLKPSAEDRLFKEPNMKT